MANSKGKKRLRGKIAAAAVLLIAALTAGGWVKADRAYRTAQQEVSAERERFAREIVSREKAWIRLNQGAGGEIYLNHTNEDAAGDVNPYFACQAVLGLLSGNVSGDDLDAAGRYLQWHTEKLLEEGGKITNYRLKKTGLESTGKADSVDGYTALYLTALCAYAEKGGDPEAVSGADEAIALCAETLEGLLKDGLTCVSEENGTRYLMDNAEVLKACRDTARMLEDAPEKEDLQKRYAGLADTVETNIRERLWDPESGLYLIALSGSGKPVRFSGWEEFYPDALAQIFPLVCEQSLEDNSLYEKFCEAFRWENLERGDSRFPWACTAYAAAVNRDYTRTEEYLTAFSAFYTGENRKYPFHTAESGWAAAAAARLQQYYSVRQKRTLLDAVIEALR